MSTKVISQIFNLIDDGQLTDAMKMRLEVAADFEDELKRSLPKELSGLKDRLINAVIDCNSEDSEEYFVKGFKLGLRLGIECAED